MEDRLKRKEWEMQRTFIRQSPKLLEGYGVFEGLMRRKHRSKCSSEELQRRGNRGNEYFIRYEGTREEREVKKKKMIYKEKSKQKGWGKQEIMKIRK